MPKKNEKTKFQMATEDLEVIVNRICEYTRKLAQDNQVDLTRDEMHYSGRAKLTFKCREFAATPSRKR